jgi:hypothetical protein
MIANRPLVLAAILAFGCASLKAAITVGYFTDNNAPSTGPAAPITANGYTAVQIANIATFNLSTIQILLIDEASNVAPSAALLGQATAISNWVAAGGIVAIHDRNVCAGTCTPVPGGGGISFIQSNGFDIDVETSGTLVTNGPFGVIDNKNLDHVTFSSNGYAVSLPAGSIRFLNNGTVGNAVAFIYRFGTGWVYYSTIGLDFYLGPPAIGVAAFSGIYAPNVLAYLGSLVGAAPPPGPGPVTPNATAAPSLSQWGMGILAILLIAAAAFALPARPGAGTSS